MNPPLERKDLPETLDEARTASRGSSEDPVLQVRATLTSDELVDQISMNFSPNEMVGLVWELLHHQRFECHDTYVQLVDALVRDLDLVMSVDVIELHNIGEQLRMGTTTRRFSPDNTSEILNDEEEADEIDLEEAAADALWRADEETDEIDLEEAAADILREEALHDEGLVKNESKEELAEFLDNLPPGETDAELASDTLAARVPESHKKFVGMVREATDEEQAQGRPKRSSDYSEELTQPHKKKQATSGSKGQKDEPTVSMTWWQCPKCHAAQSVPRAELVEVGIPLCQFCDGRTNEIGYAKAHEPVTYRCDGCGSESRVLRCNIKPGMVCQEDDGGGIRCGSLLKLGNGYEESAK